MKQSICIACPAGHLAISALIAAANNRILTEAITDEGWEFKIGIEGLGEATIKIKAVAVAQFNGETDVRAPQTLNLGSLGVHAIVVDILDSDGITVHQQIFGDDTGMDYINGETGAIGTSNIEPKSVNLAPAAYQHRVVDLGNASRHAMNIIGRHLDLFGVFQRMAKKATDYAATATRCFGHYTGPSVPAIGG